VLVKTMTLRLDDERAATLELIARADDKTMTDAVRAAIDALIEDRRKDKAFMERLRERHERERALYERLAK
jgi:predicted transcriptional regulator